MLPPTGLGLGVTLAATVLTPLASAFVYNTFDGPGSPSCHNVSRVHDATSVEDMAAVVKAAAAQPNARVRAAGKGHMWYDTQCSDDLTIIVRTERVAAISAFDLPAGAEKGSVVVEAGVTFFQLAEYLHARGASVGYTLTNWNISFGGSVAMGAHRSSIREDSMVAAGALEMDIIDGQGLIRTVVRDGSEEWLAASTSLGLLGIIARIKLQIYPDTKVYAKQATLSEKDVLNGDIYGMIAPYATANLWWWPYKRKFHHRYYDPVPANSTAQEGFQNTFSLTEIEAVAARTMLDSGKYLPTSNMLAEEIFFGLWSKPNFREKTTNKDIEHWPVYGWNYDVLIGGLYPDQKAEWDYGLRGYTMELAFPVTMANKMLKRVRQLFDAELKKGIVMTSTYRSGINIKFGKAYFDLLGQVTYNTADGADWSKGAIMFDFPSYRPTVGDEKRFNEPFYHRLANTLIDEFPCRPHWTKNTRDVFARSAKNLDPGHLARFKAVRAQFDPKGIYRNVIGEILGFY
ncbi:FAD-binding domain-containing protein [Trichocladium antarcticum]|uniref:D-arabinono-1,4-lactone oxidase n=1 Tax=Trichocladium antarcticum TaxID=1450529 RepID=A0AAN6UQK1_9PEZI|nr:FAD-binding domain-containing protein [Trichocladium antarcticum]